MQRTIKPELFKIIDGLLASNGAAQKAIMDKDERSLFIYAFEACVGQKEVGGNNKGRFVELVQMTSDNYAYQEAWCMAMVQSMLAYVEKKLGVKSPIANGEHCLSVWQGTPKSSRVKIRPLAGAIVIWQHGKTQNGHTGIMIEDLGKTFLTVEGNTSGKDLSGKINRDGDGVYMNERKFSGNGDMKVVGFLIPFAA